MICFTEEDDAKLARGWPHLIVPVDGRKEDKTSAAAVNAWMKSDPIFFTEWPRKTLHRFLHWLFTPWERWDDATAKAALAKTEPPSVELCLEGLRRRVREPGGKHPFAYRNLVWGVEAIVGTDATLESIVSEMETTYATLPEESRACESVMTAAAFLLLRASPAKAKDARARMEAIFSAPRDAATASSFEGYFDALDFALHGASGVKRYLAKWPKVFLEVPPLYCAGSLDYAADDPAFVRDVIAKGDPKTMTPGMSVRVVALGGPEALALLPTRKWPAVQMPSVVRDLGMIRAPEIVTFIASLLGKSSAKDAPMTWLREHADYARPILAKQKSDAAKLALEQLG